MSADATSNSGPIPPGISLAEPPGGRAGAPDRRGGVSVRLSGVVHLYRQSGADVVGLRSVDLEVAEGEMVALLGPSGMGKTTVLRLMAGLMTASAGSVQVGERNLERMKPSERRRLRAGEISYVVQGTARNVLPYATALENVWFAQDSSSSEGAVPPWTPEQLLGHLGMGNLAHERVATLPRGMQQQVAVAAGIASAPRLLLADEPTAQLTSHAATTVVELLRTINTSFGTTVVIVTHDPGIAGRFPRTVTIRDGRVGAEARGGEVFAVIDGSGSVQLPPDALDVFPPNTRVTVVVTPTKVELHHPLGNTDAGATPP